MFIIKFNNMVRNKWLWGAFALLVAVAFGASDIWSSASRGAGERERIGLLNGKGVDAARFDAVVRLLNLERRATDSDAPVRPREAWEHYAALARAEEAGLRIPDSLVNTVVREQFRDASGAFSFDRYEEALARDRLTPVQYEAIVRCGMLLAVLRQTVAQGPLDVPSILEDRISGLTDSYTLCTATLSNRFSAASTEVTPEEVRAFYDSHESRFSEPERRQVAYVTFRAADYADKVGSFEAEGDDDPVLDYYNDHYDEYVDTDAAEGEDGPKMRPLEEVRGEIVAALAREKARDLAFRAAGDFADRFLDRDAAGLVPADFARFAAEDGYTVRTTRLFRATGDYPVNYKVSPDFVSAAFDLGGTSMRDLVGDPVGAGEEEAYVEMLVTNVPAHLEPFETVEERAGELARADKAERSFEGALRTAGDAIDQGLKAGRDFRELSAELGLELGTNVVFTYLASGQDGAPVPEPRAVASRMIRLGKGDFCQDYIPVDGGAMFFYVVDRTEGDANAAVLVRGQLARQMAEESGRRAWEQWLKANLEAMKPEPVAAFDAETDAADEAPEE